MNSGLAITSEEVVREIVKARQRLRKICRPTPLERIRHPSGASFWLKREDRSPIHTYKWRGAFNKLGVLHEERRLQSVVTASAGNHAQGVAWASSYFGIPATIFMPRSAPSLKIREVNRLGGANVRVVLAGDTFDDTAILAADHAMHHEEMFVPAFNDLHVIAGQGTMGEEIVKFGVRPQTVYLPVGGGGLAAGVAAALKRIDPNVRIVGVEANGQASMAAAIVAGRPVALEEVDSFCDGTAVRCVGSLTYPLCATLLDEMVTVSNDEVCAAVHFLWDTCRLVPEPSGALGVAALLRDLDPVSVESSLTVLSGANMDLDKLHVIARQHVSL